jgi:zinc transport system substrate-binding protein
MIRFLLIAIFALTNFQISFGEEKLPVSVVVTVAPLKQIAEKVGKDNVKVTVLVVPGSNPHVFEPTPQHLKNVSTSSLMIALGTGLEAEIMWLQKLASINPGMRVVQTANELALSSHKDGHDSGNDPHVWTSVRNMRAIGKKVFKAFSEIDPAGNDTYRTNFEKLDNELLILDRSITDKLSKLKRRKFISFHGAWSYFARDYNLEEIPVETGGKEPTAQEIVDVIKLARREGIRVVFAAPQFSPRAAEAIAREINGEVVFVDPLAEDYIKNIREIALILEKHLSE